MKDELVLLSIMLCIRISLTIKLFLIFGSGYRMVIDVSNNYNCVIALSHSVPAWGDLVLSWQ